MNKMVKILSVAALALATVSPAVAQKCDTLEELRKNIQAYSDEKGKRYWISEHIAENKDTVVFLVFEGRESGFMLTKKGVDCHGKSSVMTIQSMMNALDPGGVESLTKTMNSWISKDT